MLRSMFDFVNNYLPCNSIVNNVYQSSDTTKDLTPIGSGAASAGPPLQAETHHSVARALQTVATIFDPHKMMADEKAQYCRKNENGKNIVYLVLLGAAHSGKSTFFRQLQLLHGACFTTERERLIYRPIINENLLIAMNALVTKMPMYQISLTSPGCEKNLENFRSFIEHYMRSSQYHEVLKRQELDDAIMNPKHPRVIGETLPMSLGLSITQLWEDPGVQQIYGLSHQFQLNETAKYFLDNAKRICNYDYIPTVQDILHARLKTVGSSELRFDKGNYNFRVIDVGGQRCQRTKWLSYFNEVHGVIYIASLAGYNQTLEEDPSENRMIESIKLFYILASSSYFARTPFILFLNKTDIFREKLERFPLRMCFDQYTGPNKYEQAISFVEDRFRAHFQRSRSRAKKTRDFEDAPYLYKSKPTTLPLVETSTHSNALEEDEDDKLPMAAKVLYIHHTCATDSEQMSFVFNASADIIMESTLNQIGLS